MKRNDLLEIKKLDQKELIDKVKNLQSGVAELKFSKNMGKLKDVRAVYKKRKDLAQVLTILRQKQLLKELEARVERSNKNGEVKDMEPVNKKVVKQKEGGNSRTGSKSTRAVNRLSSSAKII